MTEPNIEQKAREVADQIIRDHLSSAEPLSGRIKGPFFLIPASFRDDIAAALQSAVAEEREECEALACDHDCKARLFEHHVPNCQAAAIEARGQKETA